MHRTLHAERAASADGPGADRIQIVVDGVRVGVPLPPEMLLLFADALRDRAREIMADRSPEATALNQAILIRAGLPVSLTSNQAARSEALVLAAHDRDLRRYIRSPPSDVKVTFGVPKIVTSGGRNGVH